MRTFYNDIFRLFREIIAVNQDKLGIMGRRVFKVIKFIGFRSILDYYCLFFIFELCLTI